MNQLNHQKHIIANGGNVSSLRENISSYELFRPKVNEQRNDNWMNVYMSLEQLLRQKQKDIEREEKKIRKQTTDIETKQCGVIDSNVVQKMVNLKEVIDKYNEFIKIYLKYYTKALSTYKKLEKIASGYLDEKKIIKNISLAQSHIRPIELSNYEFPANVKTMNYINIIRQNIDNIMNIYKKLITFDPTKNIPREYLIDTAK